MTTKVKKIRLFVSDMDGTLLCPDFTISDNNAKAIREMQKTGVIFAVATGRIRYDAVSICRAQGLNPYVISNNGACVFKNDGTLLHENRINPQTVRELAAYLEAEKISYGLGESDNYVAPQNWEKVFDMELARLREEGKEIPEEKVLAAKRETWEQNGVQIVENVQQYLKGEPAVYSLSLITYDKEAISKVMKKTASHGELIVSVSGTHNAEIMCRGGTKGQSLEFLCRYLKIPLEETAAAGDSLNDLEMLQKAGLSIAVGNAREEIKRMADVITPNGREDGLTEAIRYILQINP